MVHFNNLDAHLVSLCRRIWQRHAACWEYENHACCYRKHITACIDKYSFACANRSCPANITTGARSSFRQPHHLESNSRDRRYQRMAAARRFINQGKAPTLAWWRPSLTRENIPFPWQLIQKDHPIPEAMLLTSSFGTSFPKMPTIILRGITSLLARSPRIGGISGSGNLRTTATLIPAFLYTHWMFRSWAIDRCHWSLSTARTWREMQLVINKI